MSAFSSGSPRLNGSLRVRGRRRVTFHTYNPSDRPALPHALSLLTRVQLQTNMSVSASSKLTNLVRLKEVFPGCSSYTGVHLERKKLMVFQFIIFMHFYFVSVEVQINSCSCWVSLLYVLSPSLRSMHSFRFPCAFARFAKAWNARSPIPSLVSLFLTRLASQAEPGRIWVQERHASPSGQNLLTADNMAAQDRSTVRSSFCTFLLVITDGVRPNSPHIHRSRH